MFCSMSHLIRLALPTQKATVLLMRLLGTAEVSGS